MEEHRNRGSPRLQFTKEELENDALSRPIAKAEKAADKYDAARKKLKKQYRLKLAREESMEENQSAVSHDYEGSAGVENEPIFSESHPDEGGGASIRTDPKAPAVKNTRQRPGSQKAMAQSAPSKPQQAPDMAKNVPGVSADAAPPVATPSSASGPARKKTIHLKFEETQAKKPSQLTHTVEKAIRSAGDQLHRQAAQSNEDDNVAVDAMLKADDVKETALQAGEHAYHARNVHHEKRAVRAERKLDQANVDFLQAKYQQEHPQFSSNPLSRWQQKRAIRKEYAAAKSGKSTAHRTAKSADKAVETTADAAGKAVEPVRKHPTILVILALGSMLLFLVTGLQSCTPLVQSVLESVVIGTYPAEEADVRAAERAYAEKERALKDEMDHYKRYHPGYGEYVVEADEIWHDPYVLIAIISAYYDGEEWDINSAMPVINKYFDLQYEVTESVRTRTWTDDDGVVQTKTTCTVTLTNKDLSHLPVVSMSHHTMGMYALYMGTHGNMEGIFRGGHASTLKDPMLYDIPQETLDANPTFARLMEEATKYIGYPYVWGGSDPETSFDCSGFVSYVFTNSGVYNTGRLGAKGLRSLCRNVPVDQVQPGDIVFFEGTMGEGVAGITHCGIYVGNNMMIHCGSPIGYANLNDSYWRNHFHSYGRVPY